MYIKFMAGGYSWQRTVLSLFGGQFFYKCPFFTWNSSFLRKEQFFFRKRTVLSTWNSSIFVPNSSIFVENCSVLAQNYSVFASNSSIFAENCSLFQQNSSFPPVLVRLQTRRPWLLIPATWCHSVWNVTTPPTVTAPANDMSLRLQCVQNKPDSQLQTYPI